MAGIEWVEGTEDEAIVAETPAPEAIEQALPAIETDDLTVYFPRQAEDPGIDYDDVHAPGQLVLDEHGCIRLNEDGPVIIWPNTGFSIELIDGAVTLLDEDGSPITRVGEEISLHGSPIPGTALDDSMLEEPLPNACSGADEYRITGPGIEAQ